MKRLREVMIVLLGASALLVLPRSVWQ